jgi:hypothetical protein
VNGNGIVSLAEIDRWVVDAFPILNNKPALMRAFKTATLKEGDGDEWIERHEFATVGATLPVSMKVHWVAWPLSFLAPLTRARPCTDLHHIHAD